MEHLKLGLSDNSSIAMGRIYQSSLFGDEQIWPEIHRVLAGGGRIKASHARIQWIDGNSEGSLTNKFTTRILT